MSYNAKNYREQDGDVTVISGELKVVDDGKITIAAGAELALAGELSIADGAIITAAGTQAEAIADATDATDVITAVNAILAALRGVGIVAPPADENGD